MKRVWVCKEWGDIDGDYCTVKLMSNKDDAEKYFYLRIGDLQCFSNCSMVKFDGQFIDKYYYTMVCKNDCHYYRSIALEQCEFN